MHSGWDSLSEMDATHAAFEQAEALDYALRDLFEEDRDWDFDIGDESGIERPVIPFPIIAAESFGFPDLGLDAAWDRLLSSRDYRERAPFPSIIGVAVAIDRGSADIPPDRFESVYKPVLLLEGTSPEVRDVLRSSFGGPVLDALQDRLGGRTDYPLDAYAIYSVPRPVPLAGPGSGVHATLKGTLGARVTTAAGSAGVVTAGHVARSGAAFDDASTQIGQVVFSDDPGPPRGQPRTDHVDVSVVEIDANYSLSPQIGHSLTMATARPGDRITAHGAVSGAKTEEVWMRVKSGKGPAKGGDWSDLLMVKPAFSQHGDSGAPVFLDGTSDLVGHVVAGGGSAYTWVQEIEMQLNAAGAILR